MQLQRSGVEALDEGVMALNKDGTVADLNAAACALLGRSRDGLLGDPEWWSSFAARYEDGSPLSGETSTGARVLASGVPARDVIMLVSTPAGERYMSVHY